MRYELTVANVLGRLIPFTTKRFTFSRAPRPVFVPWATPGGRRGSPEHLRAIALAAAK